MGIKISTTKKQLSSLGDLILLKKLMTKSQLKNLVESHIPKQKIANYRNYSKFQDRVTGFISGAECLDDMDQLTLNPKNLSIQLTPITEILELCRDFRPPPKLLSYPQEY